MKTTTIFSYSYIVYVRAYDVSMWVCIGVSDSSKRKIYFNAMKILVSMRIKFSHVKYREKQYKEQRIRKNN